MSFIAIREFYRNTNGIEGAILILLWIYDNTKYTCQTIQVYLKHIFV